MSSYILYKLKMSLFIVYMNKRKRWSKYLFYLAVGRIMLKYEIQTLLSIIMKGGGTGGIQIKYIK